MTEAWWTHPHISARIAWLDAMLARLSIPDLVALEIPLGPIMSKIWTQLQAGFEATQQGEIRDRVPRLLGLLRALAPGGA